MVSSNESELGDRDRLQNLIAILISITSIVGTLIAWRAVTASIQARGADAAGFQASMKASESQISSSAEAYEHYRAFTVYKRFSEEVRQLNEMVAAADPEDFATLERQRDEKEISADIFLWFFPVIYVDKDGNYDVQREFGELMAYASMEDDTNPSPHIARADQFWEKSRNLMAIFILQMAALVFYTFAKILNPHFEKWRLSLLVLGTLCLLVGSVAGILVEIGV